MHKHAPGLHRNCLRRCLLGVFSLLGSAIAGEAAAAGEGGAPHSAARPSAAMDPKVLANCDAQTKPFGEYHPVVTGAVGGLAALGVFDVDEFRTLTVGFCPLRENAGPVATTSCENNTILLDEKYKNSGERLVLASTLAHEMKHALQHVAMKKRYGQGYCASNQYEVDKAQLETDADAFSDAVAALFYSGRAIEIDNACNSPVRIFLDGDGLILDGEKKPRFFVIPPDATTSIPVRTTSKFIRYYAESIVDGRRRWVWRNRESGPRYRVNGKSYWLRTATLTNGDRVSAPFRLRLTCPAISEN